MVRKNLFDLIEQNMPFAAGLISGASMLYVADNILAYDAHSYSVALGCGVVIGAFEFLETKYNDDLPVTNAVKNGLEKSLGIILAGSAILYLNN